MNQSFGKKINSQKSKRTLLLEFPIFLPGLNGSTNYLLRSVMNEKEFKLFTTV
ncbi:conserved hypothetical protein [Carnobacterium maltaromaticum]|nr:conserved hypothetical protein [Carnobacterium maltaromaticum]